MHMISTYVPICTHVSMSNIHICTYNCRCAQPLDTSLKIPGSRIKQSTRVSGAPEQDAMKMDLGDQIRTKDGWIWAVRSSGRRRHWVRANFESQIAPS